MSVEAEIVDERCRRPGCMGQVDDDGICVACNYDQAGEEPF